MRAALEVPERSAQRRASAPWGLVTAVCLLLLLELVLRALNPDGILPAGENVRAYRGVVPELLRFGAPEVAIVGSSRALRGVNAPSLQEALRAKDGDLRVGNFALGAAKAEEIEVTIRRLLEAKPPPTLVVWPIAPRDLEQSHHIPSDRVRYLWRPSDWWRARKAVGSAADRHLPEALRNEAARHSWLVRYRSIGREVFEGSRRRSSLRLLSGLMRGDRGPTPLHGAIDPKHLEKDGSTSRKVARERVRAYLGSAYRERGWPQNHQAKNVERAIRALQRARVRVLFIELPTHPLLEELMPKGTTRKFRKHMGGVAARHGTRFVSLASLDVSFDRADFYEHSHLNAVGARKYTEGVIAPVLEEL